MVAESVHEMARRRAGDRCEYCLLPQAYSIRVFHVDHIVARKHQIDESAENLALACFHCNVFKGPNIAGIDPLGKSLERLFRPRVDIWTGHFIFQGALIVGLTGVGRATVHVLDFNAKIRMSIRAALMERGLFLSK